MYISVYESFRVQLICNLLPYILNKSLDSDPDPNYLCYSPGFLFKYIPTGEQIMTPPLIFRPSVGSVWYCKSSIVSLLLELFLQQPLLVELFLQTLHIIHIKVNKYYQKLTLLFLRVTSLNVTSCADIFAKVCKSTTN